MMDFATALPAPPRYFPLRHGRYDVAPGLNRFGKELGGADADMKVFQLDRTFNRFHDCKLVTRASAPQRHFLTARLRDAVALEVARFIAARLVAEHPSWFRMGPGDRLHCALTGASIRIDAAAFDPLAMQVQEDLAIVSIEGDRHWLSAAHVCFPNGWAPEEKIGQSFAALHEPVAGMEEMNRRGSQFADIMVNAVDGLVRFAWGVTFDDRLNHHPALPRTPFDPANPRAFLRVERQTVWGFPQRGSALFTIRTYLHDCAELRREADTREPLIAALRSMSPASRGYKGLADAFDGLVGWLAGGAG